MSDIFAERLVKDIGVKTARDIDLDAIAHMLGITVRYVPLKTCEAIVVGCGDQAIVKINSNSMSERQRFSLGHEIGHWHHHRGRVLYCAQGDIDEGNIDRARESEKVADNYSATLLMPSFLLTPIVASQRHITWQTIKGIAADFRCSPIATALRIVDLSIAPLIFIRLRAGRRTFFRASRTISGSWFPLESPSAETSAFELSHNTAAKPRPPRKTRADAWFERRGADRAEIIEDSIRSMDFVYTLLTLDGEQFRI